MLLKRFGRKDHLYMHNRVLSKLPSVTKEMCTKTNSSTCFGILKDI